MGGNADLHRSMGGDAIACLRFDAHDLGTV
jgi:hypothetical protein